MTDDKTGIDRNRFSPPAPPPPPTAPAAENQRRSPRFPIHEASIHLTTKGLMASFGFGRGNRARNAVNLSVGGALVGCGKRIEPGTPVHVRIEIPRFKDTIEGDAEVRWCAASARDTKLYYVGLCFTGLDADQQRTVEALHRWFTSPEYKLRSATRRRP